MNTRKLLLGVLGAAALAASAYPATAQMLDETGGTLMTGVPSGPALSRANERIDELDQQMRDLTGKIEQNQYTLQQLQTTQQSQLADMQRRLQDLEVRLNSSGGSASSAASATPAATTPAVAPKTLAASSETATPVTSSGTTPAADPNGALAGAPSVKPLGSVSASDGKAQPGTPESDYEAAFTKLKDKDYEGAATGFSAFLKANPNHDLAGNAQYWLGESYYARKDYKNAAKSFAEGYQKHRTAPKAADNLLKLALSLEALGSKPDACVTFRQFKKEYKDAASSLQSRADEEITKLECPE